MSAAVTLLFTDLVNSTDLLQRVGDERAQRIFQAHHRLLKDAVAAHGGQEVKWLGDGLMSVFASAADALRAAITMQQAARRRAAGERLALRVGLHAGEALREETDYFGTPVVIARRLCEQAEAGQILASGVVVGLLAGRQAFRFAEFGPLELKGLATPVTAYEVPYQQDELAALLMQTPFVGRAAELARLGQRLRDARAGNGAVVLLQGEAGIGKTRMLEELAETARAEGATTLWGRCYEGEAARPYGPFAEALTEYARRVPAETLRADLGLSAAPLTRVASELRERLPDLPEPVALEPQEERVRLLDAVVQCLLTIATHAPTVVVVDDLHWADHGTVAMLRHVARFAPRARLLVLGAYRDVEVDSQHPLRDALGTLPRETRYEQIALAGLDTAAVQELLATIADQEVPQAFVTAITQETSGNPFFIREVLLHLVEEGQLVREGGRWSATVAVEAMRIPDTVRQVIERRLGRLGGPARRLLDVAALFTESVRFDIAAQVLGLEETVGLNALDQVLAAQLLKSTSDPHAYEFTHALVRHTLYDALNPPRRVRLHRRIAAAMERMCGANAERYAGEIAWQYYQSAALPGAERGVPHCLAAADRGERAGALEEVADALAMALELLPADDGGRGRLLARRGRALSSTKRASEAAAIAIEAAELVAVSDGRAAAADYLAEVAGSIVLAGTAEAAWAVARRGLTFAEGRRDWAWAVLCGLDLDRRDAEDPEHPGIVVDAPERREIAQFSPVFERNQGLGSGARAIWWSHWGIFASRQAALETTGPSAVYPHIFFAGAYRDALPLAERLADAALERGELPRAAFAVSACARLHAALGDLASAERELVRLTELAERAGNPPLVDGARELALLDIAYSRGTGLELGAYAVDAALARDDPATRWHRAATHSLAAVLFTFAGREEDALRAVARAMPAVERAAGGSLTYTALICRCCEALWRLGRTDFADVLKHNLLAKTLAGDFREPGVDARLAMAQLCAVTGHPSEAHRWFERARALLDEQGARPLRALVDLDEAWMEVRRGPHGDRDRARALLDVAMEQFQAIGMPGWIERAEALRAQCDEGARGGQRGEAVAEDAVSSAAPRRATLDTVSSSAAIFRYEGDFWTLAYGDVVCRVKDAKGLHYIAYLLRHPGREFHVLDLIACGLNVGQRPEPGEGLPILDAPAKAAYQERLSELRDELDEAERFNDAGRAARAREEMDAIAEQLAAAVGLGGRDRKAASSSERVRSTLTKVVKAALNRISDHHAALGRHLTASIKTGTFCSYAPDGPPAAWVF